MANLSKEQIAMYASSAGFTGDNVKIAVAVAMAESGGNPKAHNPVPPDNSYGLWQINMLGSMGPARRKQFNLKSNADLFDPAINAKAAFAISSGGTNWKPWSTYTNGAYKKYLDGSVSTTGNGSSTSQAGFFDDAMDVADSIGDGVDILKDFANWITNPQSWVKIAYGVGGVILVAIGLSLVARTPVNNAAKQVINAVPQGKTIKAAAVKKFGKG
jgi:hypothetical protein